MPSNSNSVCIPCRFVAHSGYGGTCPHCGGHMISTNYRWRAPKKTNDKAWARIAAGDWAWENDPRHEQWRKSDMDVDHQNPKHGKTKLFPTLAQKFKNAHIRYVQRNGHGYRF